MQGLTAVVYACVSAAASGKAHQLLGVGTELKGLRLACHSLARLFRFLRLRRLLFWLWLFGILVAIGSVPPLLPPQGITAEERRLLPGQLMRGRRRAWGGLPVHSAPGECAAVAAPQGGAQQGGHAANLS